MLDVELCLQSIELLCCKVLNRRILDLGNFGGKFSGETIFVLPFFAVSVFIKIWITVLVNKKEF